MASSPVSCTAFPGNGKRPSNRVGWRLLFDDGRGGCFGDWSTGFSETWQAKRDKPYSQAERAAFACWVEEAKRQAEVERHTRQADVAKRAAAIWSSATHAPGNHPYLLRKRIQPHGARIHRGALTLPVTDVTGRLISLQFIAADGGKLLLFGGRKRGCFIPVAGDMDNPDRVIICEGWAGDYARAIATDTETPPELAACMVLVTCATALHPCAH